MYIVNPVALGPHGPQGTQTCDLVRRCADRPFVEVSPLVEVDDRVLREVERGRRPNYGFIPGVAPRRLVADLDRVMTVEKAVVAAWARVEGSRTDDDARRLSLALARKRARTPSQCFIGPGAPKPRYGPVRERRWATSPSG